MVYTKKQTFTYILCLHNLYPNDFFTEYWQHFFQESLGQLSQIERRAHSVWYEGTGPQGMLLLVGMEYPLFGWTAFDTS